jgi:hypothetical protein
VACDRSLFWLFRAIPPRSPPIGWRLCCGQGLRFLVSNTFSPSQLNRALRVLRFLQASSTLALRRSTAFATRFGCQIPIGRKTSRLWRYGAPTFASRIGGEGTIVREASLFMRDVGTALSGNLPLLVDIHAGEAT